MTRLLIIFFTLFVSLLAFGQTAAPELSWIESSLKWITSLEAAGWTTGVSILLELAFRLIKTDKPKSILYLVADGCKMLGVLFTKIGATLDKILPQRIKP